MDITTPHQTATELSKHMDNLWSVISKEAETPKQKYRQLKSFFKNVTINKEEQLGRLIDKTILIASTIKYKHFWEEVKKEHDLKRTKTRGQIITLIKDKLPDLYKINSESGFETAILRSCITLQEYLDKAILTNKSSFYKFEVIIERNDNMILRYVKNNECFGERYNPPQLILGTFFTNICFCVLEK